MTVKWSLSCMASLDVDILQSGFEAVKRHFSYLQHSTIDYNPGNEKNVTYMLFVDMRFICVFTLSPIMIVTVCVIATVSVSVADQH